MLYTKTQWSQEKVSKLRQQDVPFLKQEASWAQDYKVVQWCDEALAAVVAKEELKKFKKQERKARQAKKAAEVKAKVESGLVPVKLDVRAYQQERDCGLVDVSESVKTYWVRL